MSGSLSWSPSENEKTACKRDSVYKRLKRVSPISLMLGRTVLRHPNSNLLMVFVKCFLPRPF